MSLKDLPKSVLSMVQHYPSEYQGRIFKMAFRAYLPTAEDHSSIIENFSKETNMQKGQIYDILGVYIALIRLFLENSENEFNQILLEYGFATKFLETLPFFSSRNGIINNLMNNQNTDFGKMSLMRWRIDISLSNSALIKKVPINLLMSISMKNGKTLKIKIEAKEFHRLRFNIALILKELNSLKLNK